MEYCRRRYDGRKGRRWRGRLVVTFLRVDKRWKNIDIFASRSVWKLGWTIDEFVLHDAVIFQVVRNEVAIYRYRIKSL